MLVFTCRYNTWHVLFEVQHTACVVLFEHITLVASKQHAESVVPNTDHVLKQRVAKTTHITCHKQHTGVLNLHPVMCYIALAV